MNRLLRVEITRLTWRKVPLLSFIVLLVIVLLTLGAIGMQARDSRPGSAAYEQAIQWYEADKADYELNGDEYLADCLEMEALDREELNDPAIDYDCEATGFGSLDDYLNSLEELAPQSGALLAGLTPIFVLVPLLIGASATATEYSHRTMGTWLSFEPRRTLVYFSKLLAVALVSAPLIVLMLTITTMGLFAVYQFNGLPTEMSSQEWSDLIWRVARITVLSAVSASFGAATGTLLRSTSAVLGLVLVYALAGETLIGALVPSLTPALLGSNIKAFAQNGWTWFTYPACDDNGPCEPLEQTISLLQGGTVLAVVALVVIVGAWLVFRRRDVQ